MEGSASHTGRERDYEEGAWAAHCQARPGLTCRGPVPAAFARDLPVHKLALVVTPVLEQQFPAAWRETL